MNKAFSYTEVLKLLLWKMEKCDKNTSRIGTGMFNNVCRSRIWEMVDNDIFKNPNMRHIILLLLSFLNFSSCITCDKIVQDLRPIEYSLKGQSMGKHENRFLVISGIDNFGEHKCIKIPYFWEIEENYQPGDYILKKKGETDICLIRGDMTIVLPMYCDQELVRQK